MVQESIVQSLKGAAAGMAWYMGPSPSVREILQKLAVIFGMVASFDVLMQNFYKVMHPSSRSILSATELLHKVILTFCTMQLGMHWIHSKFKISDEMYPPKVQAFGDQGQYYIRTALHVICSFPFLLLERQVIHSNIGDI